MTGSKTGVMSPDVAAHLYATMKVAEQVARDEIDAAALGRYSEYNYYLRKFAREVAGGIPVAWAPWVKVEGAAREGVALISFVYDPEANRLVLGFENHEKVDVTSTFDNGRWLAVRIGTEEDPQGLSGVSEVLSLDRMEVTSGFSGVTVRAEMVPPVAEMVHQR